MELFLTVNEIVETLKRSSLTTVLVEGKDDMLIYRWMEDEIGLENANFLSCGGRDNLLKIFDRRSEFSHIKTIFIADKDTFVYHSPPDKYKEIVWTKGYSIENDLYQGKNIEKLLSVREKINFRISLQNFITYYAFEIEQFNKSLVYNFSNHPNQVLNDEHKLNQDFLKDINFVKPQKTTIDYLNKEYDLLIRGKSLFALLLRFLSNRRRKVKHNKKSLLENCYKMHKSEAIKELMVQVENKLYA